MIWSQCVDGFKIKEKLFINIYYIYIYILLPFVLKNRLYFINRNLGWEESGRRIIPQANVRKSWKQWVYCSHRPSWNGISVDVEAVEDETRTFIGNFTWLETMTGTSRMHPSGTRPELSLSVEEERGCCGCPSLPPFLPIVIVSLKDRT